MKSCPHCGSSYSEHVDFCFHDGAVLERRLGAPPLTDTPLDPPEPDGLGVPEPARSLPRSREASPEPPDQRPTPLQVLELPAHGITADAPPERVASPLVAPPPPRRAPEPRQEPEPAVSNKGTTDLDDEEDDAATPGVPLWLWASLAVAVVLLLLGGGVMLGGVGMLTALTLPEAPAVRVDAPSKPPVELEYPEPEPPLALGVQGDTDTDVAGTDVVDTDVVDTDLADTDTTLAEGEGAFDTETGAATPDASDTTSERVGVDEPAVAEVERTAVRAATSERSEPSEPVAEPAEPARVATPTDATTPAEATSSAESSVAPEPVPDGAVQVRVIMVGGGEGVRLSIDDRIQVGNFPFAVFLSPGRHTFQVEREGGSKLTITKDVQPDEDGNFELRFPAL